MVFIMRLRFNEVGVEYRGIAKTLFAPWSEIARVAHHGLMGVQVHAMGATFPVPRYFAGVYQFMDQAASRGIEVPRAFRREAV